MSSTMHSRFVTGGTWWTQVPAVAVPVRPPGISFCKTAGGPPLASYWNGVVINVVTGVTAGFSKELEIQGVGYRAEMKGNTLNLLLGFSHPVEMEVPDGLKVSCAGPTNIKVEGIDKQQVGQFAADIRSLRPPEPYKGKGVRYVGEHVRRKVGKAAGAGAA